jgi:hypothetical protein
MAPFVSQNRSNMTRTVLAAALLLCPAVVVAQADAPAPTPQDPQAAYDELARAFNKAIADWQDAAKAAIEAAQKTGAKVPAIATTPPTKEYIAKAQELAGQHAGKDAAVPFLAFILKNARTERNAVKKAVETLASDHAKSAAIGDVIPHLERGAQLGAKKPVMALLDDVVANHTDTECKAKALILRGTLRLQAATADAERKVAEKDLRDVATVTKDEDLLAQAKDALFEIEHLQIGCTAPEIEGVDTDGVAFKLSDYRGKVVLLDFWGFW